MIRMILVALFVVINLVSFATPVSAGSVAFRLIDQYDRSVSGSSPGWASARLCRFDSRGVCNSSVYYYNIDQFGYGYISEDWYGQTLPAGRYRIQLDAGGYTTTRLEFNLEGLYSYVDLGDVVMEMTPFSGRFVNRNAAGWFGVEKRGCVQLSLMSPGAKQSWVQFDAQCVPFTASEWRQVVDIDVVIPQEVPDGEWFCLNAEVIEEGEGKISKHAPAQICGLKGVNNAHTLPAQPTGLRITPR